MAAALAAVAARVPPAVFARPPCGHSPPHGTATRLPPAAAPTATAAEISCEACFRAVAVSDAEARLRARAPCPAGTACFLCGRGAAGAVRAHPDLALPVCDACLLASAAQERALSAAHELRGGVVPDAVAWEDAEGVAGVLYIGPKEAAVDRATLDRLGITRVLVCCDSLRALHTEPPGDGRPALIYHRLALADSVGQSLTPFLHSALAFIAQGALAGERTLVHCNAGVSRSGSRTVAEGGRGWRGVG
jgi:hypothetical protein